MTRRRMKQIAAAVYDEITVHVRPRYPGILKGVYLVGIKRAASASAKRIAKLHNERAVLEIKNAVQPKAGVLDANQHAHVEGAIKRIDKIHDKPINTSRIKADLWDIRQHLVMIQQGGKAT